MYVYVCITARCSTIPKPRYTPMTILKATHKIRHAYSKIVITVHLAECRSERMGSVVILQPRPRASCLHCANEIGYPADNEGPRCKFCRHGPQPGEPTEHPPSPDLQRHPSKTGEKSQETIKVTSTLIRFCLKTETSYRKRIESLPSTPQQENGVFECIHSGERFQKAPFSSVFADRRRRISVDERPNRIKKYPSTLIRKRISVDGGQRLKMVLTHKEELTKTKTNRL